MNGLPQIEWCEVPAGAFISARVTTHRQLTIPYTYWIAKYPVTYAQYEPFVVGDGYTNKDYWTETGWAWKGEKTQPEAFWDDAKWHIANHPVVEVTWYEAYAYCRWLDERLRRDAAVWRQHTPEGAAADKYVVRLLTEGEWEKATRYGHGKQYPWGSDEYQTGYANVNETRNKVGTHYLQRTSAVGMYPQGAHPTHGAHDLSRERVGVVSDQLGKGVSSIRATTTRQAMTGGACAAGLGSTTQSARGRRSAARDDPRNGDFSFRGFRVCLSSVSFF